VNIYKDVWFGKMLVAQIGLHECGSGTVIPLDWPQAGQVAPNVFYGIADKLEDFWDIRGLSHMGKMLNSVE
jgi:hypothetical protein